MKINWQIGPEDVAQVKDFLVMGIGACLRSATTNPI